MNSRSLSSVFSVRRSVSSLSSIPWTAATARPMALAIFHLSYFSMEPSRFTILFTTNGVSGVSSASSCRNSFQSLLFSKAIIPPFQAFPLSFSISLTNSSTLLNFLYTEANRIYATLSSRNRCCRTSSPSSSVGMPAEFLLR